MANRNSFESDLFSDDVILKLAKNTGIKIVKPIDDNRRIKVSSDQFGVSIKKLGGGFVKYSHRIWQLKKEGEDYFLERMEDEEGLVEESNE